MTEPDRRNPDWPADLGWSAFHGYREAVAGRTHDDLPIPGWADLGDEIQRGWIEAGKAAVRRALDLGIVRTAEPDQEG